MADLKEHIPTSDYLRPTIANRLLELMGGKGVFETPYKSEYPIRNKVMDAMITFALDPIIKPISAKRGALDKLPNMKKLGDSLVKRGYLHQYDDGSVGIGAGPGPGGPGGDSGGGPGTGPGGSGNSPTGPGDDPGTAAAVGNPNSPTGDPATSIGDPEGSKAGARAAFNVSDPSTFGPAGYAPYGSGTPASQFGAADAAAAAALNNIQFGPPSLMAALKAALAALSPVPGTGRALGIPSFPSDDPINIGPFATDPNNLAVNVSSLMSSIAGRATPGLPGMPGPTSVIGFMTGLAPSHIGEVAANLGIAPADAMSMMANAVNDANNTAANAGLTSGQSSSDSGTNLFSTAGGPTGAMEAQPATGARPASQEQLLARANLQSQGVTDPNESLLQMYLNLAKQLLRQA